MLLAAAAAAGEKRDAPANLLLMRGCVGVCVCVCTPRWAHSGSGLIIVFDREEILFNDFELDVRELCLSGCMWICAAVLFLYLYVCM